MRLIFSFLTVSILAAVAATVSDSTQYPAEGCPPGWIDSVEGCFLFYFAKVLTWADAQLECEKLGGFLAEPRREEQAALLTSLAFVEENVLGVQSWWLGLSDRGHEGRWTWQHSVEDVNYTNWAPGAPSGSEINKDCAIMNTEEKFDWSDENCLQARAAPICQRVATTGEPDTTAAATTNEATTPSQYFLELRGGDGVSSGNVFVTNADGYFGPVCDDEWQDVDAQVVCRQLGFLDGNATIESYFESGVSTNKFAMDDVECTGSEDYLQECQYRSQDNCRDYEAAGVFCDSTYYVELRGGDEVSSGNVYAFNLEGFFGPVCDDGWSNVDAQVVCRQLGFSDGVATVESYFGRLDTNVFSMDYTHCDGSEEYLQECPYSRNEDCEFGEGAGVVCY